MMNYQKQNSFDVTLTFSEAQNWMRLTKSSSINTNLFLDMEIALDRGKAILPGMKKTSDKCLILLFISLTPALYHRNLIEGVVHGVLNSTSIWQLFLAHIIQANEISKKNNLNPSQFDYAYS